MSDETLCICGDPDCRASNMRPGQKSVYLPFDHEPPVCPCHGTPMGKKGTQRNTLGWVCKAARAENDARYRQSPKGKEAKRRYDQSPKGKEAQRRADAKRLRDPERRKNQRDYRMNSTIKAREERIARTTAILSDPHLLIAAYDN